MSYLHCKIQCRVAHVLGIFESGVPAASSVSFRTGSIALPGTLPAEPWVYTGTQSESSVDGTIDQDFKTPKVAEILRKTEQLLKEGVSHGGHEFASTDNAIEKLSPVTVDPFVRSVDGSYYELADAPDLATMEAACTARRLAVLDSPPEAGGE